MRVSVRRADERAVLPAGDEPLAAEQPARRARRDVPARRHGVVRVESPMVGTFYRAPEPGAAPFVEVGDVVEVGQTLCILEAMKLMNEVKAERRTAIVRAIHVENAQPVEYGQLLFELEPLTGARRRALGAPCSPACSSRTEARSPCG